MYVGSEGIVSNSLFLGSSSSSACIFPVSHKNTEIRSKGH